MGFVTRCSTALASVLVFGLLCPAVAHAVQITKPLTGESILEENIPEQAPIVLAGHYATAAGTPLPYNWACAPAGSVLFDYTPDPVNRHTVRIMANLGIACAHATITLTVFDTGDGTQHTIELHPANLKRKDNNQAPQFDRIVGMTQDGSTTIRERQVGFLAEGLWPVINCQVRIRTYWNATPAAGQIDIVAYDGDPLKISELTPNCTPLGAPPPMGEWLITVPVTCSCPATMHWLTVQGRTRSARMDDIEVDILAWQQGAVYCPDGIGAVMDYTVCEVDLTVETLTEAQEEDPGEYAYRETPSNKFSRHRVRAEEVLPVLPGYKLRVRSEIPPDPPPIWLADPASGPFTNMYVDRGINAGLPYDFDAYCARASGAERDSEVRVFVVHDSDGQERGGSSCRDQLRCTGVVLELICPTAGALTAPADASTNGNEWTYSTAATPLLDIYPRVTSTFYSAPVLADLADNIEFYFVPDAPIPDATLAWTPAGSSSFIGVASHTASGGGLPERWESRARFTGMPQNNSGFGVKDLQMRLRHPDTDAVWHTSPPRPSEVFYSRNATNHPLGQAGSPNWYYYWGQTAAGYGTHVYIASGSSHTDWNGSAWEARLADDARMAGGATAWGAPAGIDRFAWVARHEETHRVQLIAIWGASNRSAATDADADWLRDTWESATAIPWQLNLTIGGVAVNHYDPALAATTGLVNIKGYNGNFTDCEDYCMENQPDWINGSANAADWGDPGMRHATNDRCDD